MATLKTTKSPSAVGRMSVNLIRKEYLDLAKEYEKVASLKLVYCPLCGEFKTSNNFYSSKKTKSGINHFGCKSCILDMATDYYPNTNERKDNRNKTVEVFRLLDLKFKESDYEAQLQKVADNVAEKQRETAFQQLITMVFSLPQYRNKNFKDSEFGEKSEETRMAEETKIVQKTINSARKRFGNDFTDEDLMFLETEYQDWVSRYDCNTKAQETIFERLAFKKWEINKATKSGASTKDLDRTYQDLLSSINILPRQSAANGISDSLTFGQLIEKWEDEKPIPEPSDEFKDVDGIGKYIRVWFKGHLARALGLDNGYSKEYDDYVEQYTVKKPEYSEDGKSEAIYSKLFGKEDDGTK